jgi:minichromosome maintenance protein 10
VGDRRAKFGHPLNVRPLCLSSPAPEVTANLEVLGRLRKRTLAHDLLQSHLSDRFHVPPSILYSIIRLSRDGTFYDIPLSGDWITIAVVAEQNGGVRTTKGGPAIGNEASDDDELDEPSISSLSATASGKGQQASKKKGGPRKFVSFKLVSLPTRSSGQTASQGDASLTMLLFEADSCTKGVGGKKIYKGGSRGAYEKFWNVRIGTVIAVLNPRVLRPLKVRFISDSLPPLCRGHRKRVRS